MDSELLKTVGQVAGIGGVALGVFLILFREVIRKQIFPSLTKAQAYRLLSLVVILVWSVALAGIGAWVYTSVAADPQPATLNQQSQGSQSPNVGQVKGDVTISINQPSSESPAQPEAESP